MKFRSLAVAAVAATALAAGPAAAQSQPAGLANQKAQASATALDLNVFGTALTVGRAEVALDNASINAVGLGGVLADTAFGEARAIQNGVGRNSVDRTCSPLVVPDNPLLNLAVACGTASAEVTEFAAAGSAFGEVASIDIGVGGILDATPLADTPAQVDSLLDQLSPILQPLADAGLDVGSVVSELVHGIVDGGNLVEIDLAPSAVAVTSNPDELVSEAVANGAVIRVLDRSLLGLEPILTVVVGEASSTVTQAVDQDTVTEVNPSIVTIDVASDVAALLGLPQSTVTLAAGETFCLPLPDPLGESCIVAADGSTSADSASSSAVSLNLLDGLPGGGVSLSLASTDNTAGADADVPTPVPGAPVTPASPSDPTPVPMLPTTGADTPLAGVMAAAVLGLAALAVRRRVTG